MKCDETHPSCKNCVHRGVTCPGYGQTLRWSQKHEQHKPRAFPTAYRDPKQKQSAKNNVRSPGSEHEISADTLIQNVSHEISSQSLELDSFLGKSHSSFNGSLAGAHYTPSSVSCQDNTDLLSLFDDGALSALASPYEDDGSESEQNSQILTRFLVDSAYSPRIPAQLSSSPNNDDTAQRLTAHYFDAICRALSCFDSSRSPLRADIPTASFEATHVYDCMLGVTATHMANFDQSMAVAALEYQVRTMRSLQQKIDELSTMEKQTGGASNAITTFGMRKTRHHVLLTTILLGVTANWYELDKQNTLYLHGARTIFREWLVDECLLSPQGCIHSLSREQSFVVGAIAYWESLNAFITDQRLESLDYLLPFCSLDPSQPVHPNPGTGICTPLFVYLAGVGTLLRQQRILNRLKLVGRAHIAHEEDSDLFRDAQRLHSLIVEFRTPQESMTTATEDPKTPISHLYDVARVYRLVSLLELYQAFPLLAAEQARSGEDGTLSSPFIFDIATSILTVVRDLPRDSGTFTVLGLALISAGSAIQRSSFEDGHRVTDTVRFSLQAELGKGRQSNSAVDYWRDVFHHQITHSYKRCGIRTFLRAEMLIQEVWRQADSTEEAAYRSRLKPLVHWMDVMTDQKMEALYG